MPKIVKIVKIDHPLESQRFEDGGKRWTIHGLIHKAKRMEQYDLPLYHMDLSGVKIGGMPVREFVGHMLNIFEADMSCPIILDEDGYVMDGRHRVARALYEKLATLKAVRFDKNPDEDYFVDKK